MAVLDWLSKVDVKEDYVLIIDADMIMRSPVIPAEFGAEPGKAQVWSVDKQVLCITCCRFRDEASGQARSPACCSLARSFNSASAMCRLGSVCLLQLHEGRQQRAGVEARAPGVLEAAADGQA